MLNTFKQHEKEYIDWLQGLENPDTLRKREAAENWCKRRGMRFILISKEMK